MTPAKVARIGRKHYAREELPPSYWREQMRAFARFVLLGLLGWLVAGLILVAFVVN